MVKVNKGILKENNTPPILSIIIPHHAGFDILNNCLKSIKKSTFDNYEIIIVDNNSTDKSITKIKTEFTDIKIIELNNNLGYAGGCNEGALNSKGEYLLFLNNDTVHDPGWIEPLMNIMINDQTISSVQPKILNINNNNYFDYAGGSGGFIDILCFPFARGRIFNNLEQDVGQYNDKNEIFWSSGCCFITRKDLFIKIQFDTTLFAYMEEIDYAWKSILMGYKNVVEPKSIIFHDGGELKSRNFFKSYMNHRNSMILFITNHNTILMILLLIPKILLELISLTRYLIILNITAFNAQIFSYLWILCHPIYLLKRISFPFLR